MKSVISNSWLQITGLALTLALAGGCGQVLTPEPEPPAQVRPSRNQVTSATGVVRGARFTMRVQVGHAYSQKPVSGAHRLGTASPLNKGTN